MANNGRFVADLTIPDDTEIRAGSEFVKTWRLQNSGDTAWGEGYHLVFVGGTPMTDILGHPLPPAAPGQQVDISLNLTAPNVPGTHFGDWKMQDNMGGQFGDIIYLRIVVPEAIAPPPPQQPTPQPQPINVGSGGGISDGTGQANGRYLADITIPDGARLNLGELFTKTWRVENNGETIWSTGYHIVHVGGEPLTDTLSQPVPTAAPGQQVEISISLATPNKSGHYISQWKLQDSQDQQFGDVLFLDINALPQITSQWAFEPARWRDAIWAITSIFESGRPHGNPSAYQTYDAGIISYGKHQATLGSGTLNRVVQAYFQRSNSPTKQALQQEYGARIAANDANLRHDPRI